MPVKEVEGGFEDLSDMLIFGGCGTKMEASVVKLQATGRNIVMSGVDDSGGADRRSERR